MARMDAVCFEPFHYFSKFFSKELIELIVYQTNLYSTQKQVKSINVTVNEMKDFLGITILMGITQLPSLRDYWSESFRFDLIAKHVTRNRYAQTRHNLHFVDNSTISKETTKNCFIR